MHYFNTNYFSLLSHLVSLYLLLEIILRVIKNLYFVKKKNILIDIRKDKESYCVVYLDEEC
jgi:hypothetical protein